MLRKLLVNVMALFAVLVVAGGAMAAVNTFAEPSADEQAPDDAHERVVEAPVDGDGGQLQARIDRGPQALAAGEWDTGEFENFGQARSAQVHAYKACRKSGAEDCEKPGPAHENPYHPRHRDNDNTDADTDDADELSDEGERPEEVEAARTGGKPANAKPKPTRAGGKGKNS